MFTQAEGKKRRGQPWSTRMSATCTEKETNKVKKTPKYITSVERRVKQGSFKEDGNDYL